MTTMWMLMIDDEVHGVKVKNGRAKAGHKGKDIYTEDRTFRRQKCVCVCCMQFTSELCSEVGPGG